MWDLVPWPGIEPGPPALGARSPIHCTTREVPLLVIFYCILFSTLSGTPVILMFYLLCLSHRSLRLFHFFFGLFSLLFRLGKFWCSTFKLTDSFLCLIHSVLKPSSFLVQLLYFSVLKYPFVSSLYLFFLCWDFQFFICFRCVCNYSLKYFSVALKSLSDNSMCDFGVGVCWLSFFVCLFYYYLVVSGLSCGTRIFVAARGLFLVARRLICPAAFGILVPPPGIQPASPALEAGFFTTGPPAKSLAFQFLLHLADTALFANWRCCATLHLSKSVGAIFRVFAHW